MKLNWLKYHTIVGGVRYKAQAGVITLEVAPEDLDPEFWCAYVLGEMQAGHASAQFAQKWAEGKLRDLLDEALSALK